MCQIEWDNPVLWQYSAIRPVFIWLLQLLFVLLYAVRIIKSHEIGSDCSCGGCGDRRGCDFIYSFLVLHSHGLLSLARNGFPASEPSGPLEAACCLCPGLFYCEEQAYRALWESHELFGRNIQTSAKTSDPHQTHEDHVWPEDHGTEMSWWIHFSVKLGYCSSWSNEFFKMSFIIFLLFLSPCLLCFQPDHYVDAEEGQRNGWNYV